MNALLNYPGAKWGMAKNIVALMPPHRSYLEPFFGSGAVLFSKPPSAIETVNDMCRSRNGWREFDGRKV